MRAVLQVLGGRAGNVALVVLALLFMAGHGAAVARFQALPREATTLEMQVALPRTVQLLLAAGDRYLAANMATYRALVANTRHMQAENYVIQARVQQDAAWFNPAHEDNYYVAAAILPWNQQVDAAQFVLQRATAARPFDFWPAFYYGFGVYTFERDARRAAEILRDAAGRARGENNRLMLESVAARWYQRGASPEETLVFLQALAAQSQYATFRAYLATRARRVEGQIALQKAVDAYRRREGEWPASLDVLVAAGLIQAVPDDPYRFGYLLQPDGQVVLLESRRK
jgi:hypothetical protein